MSKLFDEYPIVTHTFKEEKDGKVSIKKIDLKDITIKFDISPSIKSGGNDGSTEKTYRFLAKDNMRPDSLSNIYYKDPYNFWIILKANDIYEHYSESAIPSNLIENYLYLKYREEAVVTNKPNSTEFYKDTVEGVVSYTKDKAAQFVNGDGFIVDEFQIGASKVSIYDLEIQENEARRNIKIINDDIAPDIEKELSDKLNELN